MEKYTRTLPRVAQPHCDFCMCAFPRYGLSRSSDVHSRHNSQTIANETRRRLEEAGRKKSEEDRKKAEMRCSCLALSHLPKS